MKITSIVKNNNKKITCKHKWRFRGRTGVGELEESGPGLKFVFFLFNENQINVNKLFRVVQYLLGSGKCKND